MQRATRSLTATHSTAQHSAKSVHWRKERALSVWQSPQQTDFCLLGPALLSFFCARNRLHLALPLYANDRFENALIYEILHSTHAVNLYKPNPMGNSLHLSSLSAIVLGLGEDSLQLQTLSSLKEQL